MERKNKKEYIPPKITSLGEKPIQLYEDCSDGDCAYATLCKSGSGQGGLECAPGNFAGCGCYSGSNPS